MLKKIGHYSMENPCSIFDEEAMTALELAGRTAKKVNECVDTINKHLEDCAITINSHIDDCEEEHQGHRNEVAQTVQAHKGEVAGIVQEQERKNQEARQYMKDNLEQTCGDLFDQAVEAGVFDTVTREAYAKLTAGSYNVLDFGAKGDGITDDTQAIQLAIEASRNGEGTTVYLPAGNYRVTETLIIYSHTRLIGAGKRGISDNGYSGTQITGDTVSPVIRSAPGSTVFGAEIRDIRVGCVGTSGGYGIQLDGVSECYLNNVQVHGAFDTGLYFRGTITNLDNLYIVGAKVTGVHLKNTHAVTVSNLNAWINKDKAIVLEGECYNLTIRDSWIENSRYGVYVDTTNNPFLGHCLNIQNTSYTCSKELDENTTLSSAYFIYGVMGEGNNLSLNNLVVRSCVVKIVETDYAIRLGSTSNTITATFENCAMFTNNTFTAGICINQKYHLVKVENNICTSYTGTKFDIVSGGRVFGVNNKVGYTELTGVVRLAPLDANTSLENMDAGQVYYKNGQLRVTDGTASRIIPVGKGEEIGLVFPVGVDTGLTDWLSELVGILHRSGILHCSSIKDELG